MRSPTRKLTHHILVTLKRCTRSWQQEKESKSRKRKIKVIHKTSVLHPRQKITLENRSKVKMYQLIVKNFSGNKTE